MIVPTEIVHIIEAKAVKYNVPARIIYGICMQESNCNQFAARFEPAWKYLVDPKKVKPKGCSTATEENLQKFSYGIMQVMGSVLREIGYSGWLPEIYSDAELQIEFGTLHLAKGIKRWGSLERGISAYNCGTPDRNKDGQVDNPEYVSGVMRYAQEWDQLKGSR